MKIIKEILGWIVFSITCFFVLIIIIISKLLDSEV